MIKKITIKTQDKSNEYMPRPLYEETTITFLGIKVYYSKVRIN